MVFTRRMRGDKGPPPPKLNSPNYSGDKHKRPIACEKLYLSKKEVDTDWQPSFGAVVKMLLSIRLTAALWGIINDCDEVYNYWETLHLFLYGEGFQTWEYSPIYAIRSYFYIYLHYIPASLLVMIMGDSKIAIFTIIRLMLGIFCLFGEYYAFTAICKKINISTGRFFILFSMLSSGVFLACTAFVPSSFCMTLSFYMIGAYLLENWTLGIFCVALSTLVGWPFSAVLGLPIVFDMLVLKHGLKLKFLITSFLIGSAILAVQVFTDSYYFGRIVFAPLNIFLYNVVSGPGPELYGKEPLMFYIRNLFLNWNIAMLFVPFGLPLSFKYYKQVRIPDSVPTKWGIPLERKYNEKFIPIVLLGITGATWLAIFATQAHKEERFLFPIYPFIALFAALAVDAINRLWLKEIWDNPEKLEFIYTALIIFAFFSVSRTFSIYNNYGSHVEIYKSLQEELSSHGDFERFHDPIRVCVGKEWHRFPSSFFIPNTTTDGNMNPRKVEFRFLESEFRGLLPKPFEKKDTLANMTRHIPTEMNNLNQEEPSRYVPLNSCDYVIDVDMPATQREPDFRTMPDQFQPIISMPFIDQARSHPIWRAFYFPVLSPMRNTMTNYTLYRTIVS